MLVPAFALERDTSRRDVLLVTTIVPCIGIGESKKFVVAEIYEIDSSPNPGIRIASPLGLTAVRDICRLVAARRQFDDQEAEHTSLLPLVSDEERAALWAACEMQAQNQSGEAPYVEALRRLMPRLKLLIGSKVDEASLERPVNLKGLPPEMTVREFHEAFKPRTP